MHNPYEIDGVDVVRLRDGQRVATCASLEIANLRVEQLESAAGIVYADPKNKKYQIQNAQVAKAGWAYINVQKNADMYPLNGVTLSAVKSRIQGACKKFGIQMNPADMVKG